jgi:hypothetical protein
VNWTKLASNPIIDVSRGDPKGEDPTSMWKSEDGSSWLLAYAAAPAGSEGVEGAQAELMVYKSTSDIIIPGDEEGTVAEWKRVHSMLNISVQCPDFHPLPASQVRGANATHLVITRNLYCVGRYDAERVVFKPVEGEPLVHPLDYGNTYAGKILVAPSFSGGRGTGVNGVTAEDSRLVLFV